MYIYIIFLAACPQNLRREERYDGGWPGISQEECVKRGHCYDRSCTHCNWCFINPDKLTGDECPIDAPDVKVYE